MYVAICSVVVLYDLLITMVIDVKKFELIHCILKCEIHTHDRVLWLKLIGNGSMFSVFTLLSFKMSNLQLIAIEAQNHFILTIKKFLKNTSY